jgi:hypothetical protein
LNHVTVLPPRDAGRARLKLTIESICPADAVVFKAAPDMKKLRNASRNNREVVRTERDVQWAENQKGIEAPHVLASLAPGTGFVLDWLAGGLACSRDIQGFPMQFDQNAIMNAHGERDDSGRQLSALTR